MPKLKANQRYKALALLAKKTKSGKQMTINQVVEELRKRFHQNHSIQEIKKAYFPQYGVYAIQKLENATREEILEKLRRLIQERKNRIARAKKQWSNLEARKAQSKRRKRFFKKHPEKRKKLAEKTKAQMADPKQRQLRSEIMKQRMADDSPLKEKVRKAKSKELKKRWQNPKFRKKMSKKSKERWEDPENREKMSQAVSRARKKDWQNPKYRKMMQLIFQGTEYKSKRSRIMKKIWSNPELRQKASERMKKLWQNSEYRKKMLSGIMRYFNTFKIAIENEMQARKIRLAYEWKKGPKGSSIRTNIAGTTRNPETILLAKEKRKALEQALEKLTETERNVVLTTFFEGIRTLTVKETAFFLDKTKKETESVLKRALKKIAEDPIMKELWEE